MHLLARVRGAFVPPRGCMLSRWCRSAPTVSRRPVPETKKPRVCGAFSYAPKRTRTSTRLSRTRPSTWRVYQFRHRREGWRSIAVAQSGGASRAARAEPGRTGIGAANDRPRLDSVRDPIYGSRTHVRPTRGAVRRMEIGKDLTKRQQEIFDFIKKYSASHGYPPTVRDIGKAVGLASSSTVHAHLSNLEKVGLLRRD